MTGAWGPILAFRAWLVRLRPAQGQPFLARSCTPDGHFHAVSNGFWRALFDRKRRLTQHQSALNLHGVPRPRIENVNAGLPKIMDIARRNHEAVCACY